MIFYIVYENGVYKVSSNPKRKSKRMYFKSNRDAQEYVRAINRKNRKKEEQWKSLFF